MYLYPYIATSPNKFPKTGNAASAVLDRHPGSERPLPSFQTPGGDDYVGSTDKQ